MKLYFRCYPYKPRPLENDCCEHRAATNLKIMPENWCQQMLEMPEIDAVDEAAPFFLKGKFPQWDKVPRRESRRFYPFFK